MVIAEGCFGETQAALQALEFKVGPDGKFVSAIASANKLGSDRSIIPVQIIGDQDGKWNKTAYKADAFYGNPLTGFTRRSLIRCSDTSDCSNNRGELSQRRSVRFESSGRRGRR
jgi:hypothetical protein